MLTFANGGGLINSIINKLPIELHLPGYSYCGPGTKLQKRLERGDPGINLLDQACKVHDITYSRTNNLEERHKADKELEDRAWNRFRSKDASLREKTAALFVTGTMKAKRKLGMGYRKSFRTAILNPVNKILQKYNTNDMKKSASIALRTARAAVKRAGGKRKIRIPRTISFESKCGGVLPLMGILAGLGAIGSVLGGSGSVANAVINANRAKKKLEEEKRHNRAMEAIGHGLFLKKMNKGYGLFLKKQKKNL
ncbi:uncharacterized protein LOC123307036 [Coccinella septempunctata]|uniref:uncharacterized protein LOC123307036 n=1 Tax=Coccinella septempunctata TaxID=41139 RepID=UPI001D08FEAD|nr:uncharacterized protein LOC123307036 [Coccinella septempunctata]